MSETTVENRNRLRLLIAIAVLIGGVIYLIATEWASITGSEKPAPPAESTPDAAK